MKSSVFARLFAWLPLLFLLLAGCSRNQTNEGTKASSGTDTASLPGKGLPPDRPEYVDSGGFIPDGYYLMALTIDGRKVSSLELNTVQRVDSTGHLSERPTLLQPAVGFLTVSEPNSVNDSRYPCIVAVIAFDSLSVRCVATPIGEVAINGHFLDKHDYSDKFAEKSVDLLAARVVITKGGKLAHDALHRFTYHTGD
jgi:hypothetical protein